MSHANAALTPRARLRLAQLVVERGWTCSAAAKMFMVSRAPARLRHLGARREQLITEIGSQLQQMRDLLDCVCPAALDTAKQPFRSRTWIAALSVVLDRDGGDLARTRRLGPARFEHAVRRLILSQGGQNRACASPAGSSPRSPTQPR